MEKLRIVILSCAGAPLGGAVLEYIRRAHPQVMDEIVGVVLSTPNNAKRPDASGEEVSQESEGGHIRHIAGVLSNSIRWRFNAVVRKITRMLCLALSTVTVISYRSIEDFCLQRKINAYRTNNINGDEAVEYLRTLSPDLVIIMTFHHLLKRPVIDIPSVATLNVHCSLLPLYRGADPINAALRDGVAETGVTVHWVDEGMDTGDIVLQKSVPVGTATTEDELRPRLATAAGEILLKCIQQARTGHLDRQRQGL